jgi:hypothetical protein
VWSTASSFVAGWAADGSGGFAGHETVVRGSRVSYDAAVHVERSRMIWVQGAVGVERMTDDV